jgi:hypothetical protein
MIPSTHLDALLGLTTRPTVFVSYHHALDRPYYEDFSTTFADCYKAVRDNSVDDGDIDSKDPEYVIRAIREEYVTGTSCTVVLCGASTPSRKYVDWEIKATLDAERGLIGVNLPTNIANPNGVVMVPGRLQTTS